MKTLSEKIEASNKKICELEEKLKKAKNESEYLCSELDKYNALLATTNNENYKVDLCYYIQLCEKAYASIHSLIVLYENNLDFEKSWLDDLLLEDQQAQRKEVTGDALLGSVQKT